MLSGWGAVEEYLCDDLADDSEDDKRIRQAQSRALAKKKKSKSKSTTRQKPYQQRRSPAESPPNPDYNFRGFGNSYNRPGNPPFTGSFASGKYSNCHKCGKPGHWKKECPNKNTNGGGTWTA